jgi:hypothetical protein
MRRFLFPLASTRTPPVPKADPFCTVYPQWQERGGSQVGPKVGPTTELDRQATN